MKKIHSVVYLGGMMLLSISTFSQSGSPISLQRRLDKHDQKSSLFTQKPSPTIPTKPNASLTAGITDGADVHIFPSSNVQAEVTVEINKSNPQNLLASANTLLGPFAYNQGFYSSSDGGLTWAGADALQGISASTIDGDPSVSFGADGTAYMTTISGGSFGTNGYWFQKSVNGGLNWTAGVKGVSNANLDKQMNTSDNIATSPFANNFYNTWTDFNSGNGAVDFNRSTDKGTTFSTKIVLRSGAVGFGQGTNVQTGPNGEVYVCWADHTAVVSPYKATGMGFASSLNGGVSFTPASVIFPYSGTRVDNTSSTYNFTRVNDFPSMAVDKSAKSHKGRIYIAYPEANAVDQHSEIKVRFSDNKGVTWSAGTVVNIPNARQSFFPWITVDDKYGIVWVVYYAFDQATGYATNTYVAASLNGTTWFNQKASDVSHITAPIDNTNFAAGYAGDYIGIAAYNGVAHPTWMDNRNGTWQVYTSTESAHTAPFNLLQEDAPVAQSSVLKVQPNPVNNVMHLSLSGTNMQSVKLFYPNGILAKQWNTGDLTTLSVAGLKSGVYTVSVTDNKGKIYSQGIIVQ